MSKSMPCPSCGGEVLLRSFTPYVVCSYCRHILVKVSDQYKDSGEVSGIAEDMSPFQIGTEGWFRGTHFGLVGRLRMAWADGFWNEWYAYFDNGRFGWFAEAQGTVAVLFENTDAEVQHRFEEELREYRAASKILGKEVIIDSVPLVVSDIKKAECVVVEGETPRMSGIGVTYTAVDMMGANGEMATAEFVVQPSARRLFLGRYIDRAELRLSNLRELEGWPPR